MVGGGFQHDICSSALNANKYVEWVKDGSADISIHIDNSIHQVPTDNGKLCFGWLAESSSIIPSVVEWVLKHPDFFKQYYKHIFTHDKRIIKMDPSFFKFAPPNCLPWIKNKEIYPKSKNISFIVSNKNWTDGHKFRLSVLEKYKSYVDHYGAGFQTNLPWSITYNNIEESGKFVALKDYRFSFCFENDNYPSIFCEKLTDCFATGTIPIFWGTPDIGEYFDKDGIIMYDENFDISMLTEDFYNKKMDAIRNNFNFTVDLISSEDYIYKNYIE